MKPSAGWYPVGLEKREDGAHSLIWQDLTVADFNAPFFEDAIRRARRDRPDLRWTALDESDEWPLPAAIAPTAFIFHASRSGSTLLSQMFSCLEGSISISEPPILDEVLRLQQNDGDKTALFRRVVLALGQRRSPQDRFLFIKHDSWHLPWLPLIQGAFPCVPCFFVYRDPVEILWSHHRQRGSQMVPGLRDPALFDIEAGSIDPADLDGFAARVLESIFSRALPLVREGRLIALEYDRLAEKARCEIVGRLGLVLTEIEKRHLDERCRFHSKRGGDLFHPALERGIPDELLVRFRNLVAPGLASTYKRLLAAKQTPGS